MSRRPKRGTYQGSLPFESTQPVDLEALADEILEMSARRETLCQTIPMEKRGRRLPKIPQTSIISHAAAAKISVREALERASRKEPVT